MDIIPESPPEPLWLSIDLCPLEHLVDPVPEHDPNAMAIDLDPINKDLISEVPPEPLSFSIDLCPLEHLVDPVPEHDPNPKVIDLDLADFIPESPPEPLSFSIDLCPLLVEDDPDQFRRPTLPLERVETWMTTSSSSTASNKPGPGRTVGKIISIAGRRLEKALAALPEMLSTPPEVVAKVKLFHQAKVLLLGSADSGKTELLKRMRLLQREPYNSQERETIRLQVFRHLRCGMLRILSALDDMRLSLSDDNHHFAESVRNARDPDDGETFPPLLYRALSSLWDDPNVQDIWRDRDSSDFPESLSYFFSSLDRLFDIAYTPTDQDILNLEFQTTGGVIETTFRRSDGDVIIVDAGHCRGERRKWIHHFADVECILFVVNLSGYDESLAEDLDANQMQDALRIWDSICHSEFFRQTSLILFLNKYELFEQKIRTSHIRDYFPDYEGAIGDASEGVHYFKKRFRRLAQKSQRVKEREVYVHVTTSTDTGMLRVLLSALEDITLSRRIRNVSL